MTEMRPPEEVPQSQCGYCYHPDCAECNPYSARKPFQKKSESEGLYVIRTHVTDLDITVRELLGAYGVKNAKFMIEARRVK